VLEPHSTSQITRTNNLIELADHPTAPSIVGRHDQANRVLTNLRDTKLGPSTFKMNYFKLSRFCEGQDNVWIGRSINALGFGLLSQSKA
jgi:hypothetical protein